MCSARPAGKATTTARRWASAARSPAVRSFPSHPQTPQGTGDRDRALQPGTYAGGRTRAWRRARLAELLAGPSQAGRARGLPLAAPDAFPRELGGPPVRERARMRPRLSRNSTQARRHTGRTPPAVVADRVAWIDWGSSRSPFRPTTLVRQPRTGRRTPYQRRRLRIRPRSLDHSLLAPPDPHVATQFSTTPSNRHNGCCGGLQLRGR